ncbi:enolase C-terminal domain-like protein [Tunicatimonas pelagia]|uniref:enolase C-terminal domain-like protein n=1 Tax=Tunicatimonas pelagia TaxID=931531 RepID=UPI00266530B2|nr:enolase C-terminal domain-like protein [Tunicatimonas pelagia]WKN41176.1 enolase C-terminal domain-like protein [Tunicatimonas pelagia]
MHRRNALKGLGLAGLGLTASAQTTTAHPHNLNRGMKPITITKVKAIPTCPHGIELIVVKVETSEPGLYGVGCATFRQRAHAVVSAINDYLDDFCRGKDVDNIEDIWQTAYVSSYWRNGPVLNNALSGLDQALWDIKGKRAGMPVYQLLGGKCRFAVDCYAHGGGKTIEEVVENVQRFTEEGYRHVRIQLGGYGAAQMLGGYGNTVDQTPDFKNAGFGTEDDNYMNPYLYMKSVPKLFEEVRKACGEEIELLHDIHERLQPLDAINLVKSLEEHRPFFIEDPFSPENIGYFPMLRQQTTVPIAMGELYNSPHEWVNPMTERLFDFIRIHISQIGGITPAVKVARLGEWFNVRTAWHGPGDVSPVGHAANAHIDFAVWNFGIQEAVSFSDTLREIFPGAPEMKDGYMYVNEVPGLGVDVNEALALKYPLPEKNNYNWTQLRKGDGTPVRP